MSALKDELFSVWKRAQRELREECGLDKQKFMAAEIFALRTLAKQILDAATPKAKTTKSRSFVRR